MVLKFQNHLVHSDKIPLHAEFDEDPSVLRAMNCHCENKYRQQDGPL